jgi:hypothetical protein
VLRTTLQSESGWGIAGEKDPFGDNLLCIAYLTLIQKGAKVDEIALPVILAALPDEFRTPLAVEALAGGQSGIHLMRLTYAWGEAILKGPLQAREHLFYHDVAPRLAAQGIALPQILALATTAGEHYVLREAFPTLLPPPRWVADPSVLATLRRLHALPLNFAIPDAFIPSWQTIVPEHHAKVPARTHDVLDRLAASHAALVAPRCVIAGDPNSENWGVRADGTSILFDWDLVGYGTAARDLAVLAPGLGWPTLFRQIAAAYLESESGVEAAMEGQEDRSARGGRDESRPYNANEGEIARLTHDIALAKAQVAVQYINTPSIANERRLAICALLPSWIEMIAQMDAEYHATLS